MKIIETIRPEVNWHIFPKNQLTIQISILHAKIFAKITSPYKLKISLEQSITSSLNVLHAFIFNYRIFLSAQQKNTKCTM